MSDRPDQLRAESRHSGEFRRFCIAAIVVVVVSAGVTALGDGTLALIAAVSCIAGIAFVLLPWIVTGEFIWTMLKERRHDA